LKHLVARLVQTGEVSDSSGTDENMIRKLLLERIKTLDINQAKADIQPFISDQSKIEVWSKEFFISLLNRIDFQDAL
jgi:hypothetical protein